MKLVKKATINTYKINEIERLALIGILAMLNKKGEIKVLDDLSKKLVKDLLDGFSK